MVNLDYINGYLKAMACLNAEPNHYCDYTVKLLDHKGHFTDTLAHHFQSIADEHGKFFDAQLWHIKPKQITVDEFIQQINKWFFKQSYSPTLHRENGMRGVSGFIDILSHLELNKCYLYEIETMPPMWYAIQWCDLLLVYQNNYYLIYFCLDD